MIHLGIVGLLWIPVVKPNHEKKSGAINPFPLILNAPLETMVREGMKSHLWNHGKGVLSSRGMGLLYESL